MAKVVERPKTDLREADYYLWLEEQVALLREGRLEELDAESLIEEFEELATGERAAVESHATTIIEHLLKLEYSPADRPRRGWRLAIRKSRGRLRKRLAVTLRRHLAEQLADIYTDARDAASIGLEVDRVKPDALPTALPYTLDQILDPEWLPTNRHGIGRDR